MHHGPYLLISHPLAGGRSLAEVTAVAGHANVSNTGCYLPVAVDDETGLTGARYATENSPSADRPLWEASRSLT